MGASNLQSGQSICEGKTLKKFKGTCSHKIFVQIYPSTIFYSKSINYLKMAGNDINIFVHKYLYNIIKYLIFI